MDETIEEINRKERMYYLSLFEVFKERIAQQDRDLQEIRLKKLKYPKTISEQDILAFFNECMLLVDKED